MAGLLVALGAAAIAGPAGAAAASQGPPGAALTADVRGDSHQAGRRCTNLAKKSVNAMLTPRRRLTKPLPRFLDVPEVRAVGDRLHIRVRAAYRVSNAVSKDGVKADRALVFAQVARSVLPTGASVTKPVFRKILVDHKLGGPTRCGAQRAYDVELSSKASRFLRNKGVFSGNSKKRNRALRLVSVTIEQDRDHKFVDGSYDWREGNAWSAADRAAFRWHRPQRRHGPTLRGSENPSGTLTITNDTAIGVLPRYDSYWYSTQTDSTGVIAGTPDRYGSPLIAVAGAYQCFDQNSGSNPAGFSNLGTDGAPMPYDAHPPGAPGVGWEPGMGMYYPDGSVFPISMGTSVTEPIAADDSLALVDAGQMSDVAGMAIGATKTSYATAKYAVSAAGGFADGFPSPGMLVSGLVNMVDFFIANSCDGYPNLMSLSVAGQSGAASNMLMDASHEGFYLYSGACNGQECISGIQLQPAQAAVDGSALELTPILGQTPGVCTTDDCDMHGPANNVMGLAWANYDVCSVAGYGGSTCTSTPVASPQVANATFEEVNCGVDNTGCPFPAAGFPATSADPQ